MPVRIMIADDHAVVRDGLKMILESQRDMIVVSEARDGREAIAKAETFKPAIIIMDIAMPELNGIEATRIICERSPAVKIIILSMHHTLEHIHRGMQAGAWGYLLKESAGAEVVLAVRAVIKGQRYFGKEVRVPDGIRRVAGRGILKSPLDSLSQREREVLQYVVEGKTSAEIAEILLLSPKSVETYRSRLMVKLGINNIPSLVKFALLHGITPSE
jgi:DNA-binding NarL/FixJ family response regulator